MNLSDVLSSLRTFSLLLGHLSITAGSVEVVSDTSSSGTADDKRYARSRHCVWLSFLRLD